MTTEKEHTFVACHCPDCLKPLDEVPISTRTCPFCLKPLDSYKVWSTRKYDGVVILPHWVKAFGWPFLLMLGSVVWFFVTLLYFHYVEVKFSALAFSIGLIFFIVRLHVNTDKY